MKLRLSTGRELRANCGILGLPWERREQEPDELFEGYDGEVWEARREQPDDETEPLTDAERREIAEHMTRRWREWGGLA